MNGLVLKSFTPKKEIQSNSFVWWSNAFGIQIFGLEWPSRFSVFFMSFSDKFSNQSDLNRFFLWIFFVVTLNTVEVLNRSPVRTLANSFFELFFAKSVFWLNRFFRWNHSILRWNYSFGKMIFFSVKWLFYGKMTSFAIFFCNKKATFQLIHYKL